MQILKSKTLPPHDPSAMVERPRLTKALGERDNSTLLTIVAPAGYGKTSLLAQYYHALHQADHNVAWLTVDAATSGTVDFMTYVCAAISNAGVRIEPKLERLLQNDSLATPGFLTSVILEGLDRSSSRIFLCLDDVHLLSRDAALALGSLIDQAPTGARFLLASRTRPNFPVARARANGRLVELGVDDLKFSGVETQQFFAGSAAGPLDALDLSNLEIRTEGWIAGIKLAALAKQAGSTSNADMRGFSGGNRSVSDFFAEEVIASQSAAVREFLYKTSVLHRFCPALCDALTGSENARAVINEIEEKGLFLLRLDEDRNWYRYHQLFSDFLRRELADASPHAERELHLQASEWFWQASLHVEAIQHALKAKAPERAAQLLHQCCQDMTYTGKIRLVSKFSDEIPRAVLRRYPSVMLTLAWTLTRALRLEEADELLHAARSRLAEQKAQHALPDAELRHLGYLLLHREMVLAAARDDMADVEKRCNHLLQEYPQEQHPYLRGTIYGHLLIAQREQYKLDDLESLCAKAQGVLNRSIYTFASVGLQANMGPSMFAAGQTDAARRTLEHGLEEGIRIGGRKSSLMAMPALRLCEVIYENNELDYAERLIDDGLPSALGFGFIDQLMPAFLTRARIDRARGNMADAFRALKMGMGIAVERGLERMRLGLVAERIKQLLQDGEAKEAARYAKANGIPPADAAPLPRGGVTTRDESCAIAWVRVALSQDRVNDALTVARQWRSFCAARAAIRSVVRWDIMLAQLYFVGGEQRLAQRALQDALKTGSRSRLLRSFLDEGMTIVTLLNGTYQSGWDSQQAADVFALELLKASGVEPPRPIQDMPDLSSEGLYGTLGAREREILSLVAMGMRNREIALKLGMTEGSVKWYMQQVYDKVGTRRRSQAVERARHFGLIA